MHSKGMCCEVRASMVVRYEEDTGVLRRFIIEMLRIEVLRCKGVFSEDLEKCGKVQRCDGIDE